MTRLDPATLRAVAAQIEAEEMSARRRVDRAPRYGLVAGVLERLAASLRTQAIRSEQEASDGS